LRQKEVECVSTPTQGACVATRSRRQISPSNDQSITATFPPRSSGPASESDQKSRGHAIEALRPFHKCMQPCLQKEPEQGFFRIAEECKLPLQCAITSDEIRQAQQKCAAKNVDERDEHLEIRRRFCACVRDSLGKTEAEMPCQQLTRRQR